MKKFNKVLIVIIVFIFLGFFMYFSNLYGNSYTSPHKALENFYDDEYSPNIIIETMQLENEAMIIYLSKTKNICFMFFKKNIFGWKTGNVHSYNWLYRYKNGMIKQVLINNYTGAKLKNVIFRIYSSNNNDTLPEDEVARKKEFSYENNKYILYYIINSSSNQ